MGLIWPFPNPNCLTCGRSFLLGDAPSRAVVAAGPRAIEPDNVIFEFLGLQVPPNMPRVEPVPENGYAQRWLRRFWISNDGTSNRRKICPHCHVYLPHAMARGELRGKTLAIVGARGAGKSNYIGVLLNALEGRFAQEIGFNFFAQDTFSVETFQPISSRELCQKRYWSRLFGPQPAAIDATPPAAQNPDNLIPLIYRMQLPLDPGQGFRRPFSEFRALDLAVFDASGEDLQTAVGRDQFGRYIGAASGIIFLVDPFGLPGIAELLPPSVRNRLQPAGDAKEVIEGAINIVERRSGLRADQKLPIPAAVVFTKIDMLDEIVRRVKPDSPMLRDSRHPGGFNLIDNQACSQDVEEYLSKWGCKNLVQLVRSRFQHADFFAVSALGQLPGEDLELKTIAPRRVADPLLWLLWKRGYIGACPNHAGELP